jgi:tRNA-dihydrouridine synthase
VKTRIGFSPAFPDHMTIARIVEDAGADMIAVHGRLACNFHKGDADWEKLGEIKQALKIPVIGNGGVITPEDATEMVRVSGVDGVMIGRGVVGNPWLFDQICRSFQSLPRNNEASLAALGSEHWKQAEPAPENFPNIGNGGDLASRSAVPQRSCPSLGKRREVIETHLLRLVEMTTATAQGRRCKAKYIPEQAACLHFRPHLAQYIKGLRGRRDLLQHLNEMHDVKTVMDAVDRVLSQNVDATSPSRSSNSSHRDGDVASTEERHD